MTSNRGITELFVSAQERPQEGIKKKSFHWREAPD